jgi:beta-lactamase superfamily II metal-dependent hydrolase
MGYQLDFLPVGNDKPGDAIALRFGNLQGARAEQTVVIIDGGYQDDGKKLVEHVRTHYGTNKIDLVISTHPDQDHIGGLETVLKECEVGRLWMHRPWKHTEDIAKMFVHGRVTDQSVRETLRKSLDEACDLDQLAQAKKIPIEEPFRGLLDPSKSILVLGPSVPFYESLLPGFRCTPEPKAGILKGFLAAIEETVKYLAEGFDVETLDDDGETTAENNSSTILLLVLDNEYLLLTADAGGPALTAALDALQNANFDLAKLKFVQVPHHGSARNVGPTLLNRLLGPKLQQEATLRTAIVSVATTNHPKHPSKKVLNAFRRRGAPVHATAGFGKCEQKNAPQRVGWSSSTPLPLYPEVED